MHKKGIIALFGVGIALVASAAIIALGFRLFFNSRVQKVDFFLSADAAPWTSVLAALEAEMESTTPGIDIVLLQEDSKIDPDVYVTQDPPRDASGLVRNDRARLWRTVGLRLWCRLETLASWESRLSKSIILPWMDRRLDSTELASIFLNIQNSGMTIFALPSDESVRGSWASYLSGEGEPFAALKTKTVTDTIYDELERSKVLAYYSDDSFRSLIPKGSASHYRAFPIPARGGEAFSGTAWWLVVSEKIAAKDDAHSRAAKNWVKYLTSRGVVRILEDAIPGEWRYWESMAAKEEFPMVPVPRGL